MVYSESLAERIRGQLSRRAGIEEKKMFGGVGFLLRGNMCVGVWKNSLIVRLDLDYAADALAKPHVKEFDITGRPMQGWVMVEPDGLERDRQLAEWIKRAVAFVKTLPAKQKEKKRK